MYSVTLQIKTKDQLGAILDAVLKLDAVVVDLGIEEKPKQALTVKFMNEPGPYKAKKKQNAPGSSMIKLRAVLQKAVAVGEEFTPKQIINLAKARGVPSGSFYGALGNLVNAGEVSRPRTGFYKREK